MKCTKFDFAKKKKQELTGFSVGFNPNIGRGFPLHVWLTVLQILTMLSKKIMFVGVYRPVLREIGLW